MYHCTSNDGPQSSHVCLDTQPYALTPTHDPDPGSKVGPFLALQTAPISPLGALGGPIALTRNLTLTLTPDRILVSCVIGLASQGV